MYSQSEVIEIKLLNVTQMYLNSYVKRLQNEDMKLGIWKSKEKCPSERERMKLTDIHREASGCHRGRQCEPAPGFPISRTSPVGSGECFQME